jgi:hypothetical protein
MCPGCVASIALMTAGASSGGGLAALVLNKFFRNKQTKTSKREKNETSRTKIESRNRVGS